MSKNTNWLIIGAVAIAGVYLMTRQKSGEDDGGGFGMPSMPSMPQFNIPDMPQFSLPSMPQFNLPSMPQFNPTLLLGSGGGFPGFGGDGAALPDMSSISKAFNDALARLTGGGGGGSGATGEAAAVSEAAPRHWDVVDDPSVGFWGWLGGRDFPFRPGYHDYVADQSRERVAEHGSWWDNLIGSVNKAFNDLANLGSTQPTLANDQKPIPLPLPWYLQGGGDAPGVTESPDTYTEPRSSELPSIKPIASVDKYDPAPNILTPSFGKQLFTPWGTPMTEFGHHVPTVNDPMVLCPETGVCVRKSTLG